MINFKMYTWSCSEGVVGIYTFTVLGDTKHTEILYI